MNKEITAQYQNENLKNKQLIMSLFFDFIGINMFKNFYRRQSVKLASK